MADYTRDDDAETLLTELLDGDWPLSEEYFYISSMATAEHTVASFAVSGFSGVAGGILKTWSSKVRSRGAGPYPVLVAVRNGAWLRLRFSADEVVWKLEGIAARYPTTRLDRDFILEYVIQPAAGTRRIREDAALSATERQLPRATPLLLQTMLLQTITWTPRLHLAYSFVDYLVLRMQTPLQPPRINQLLERTVVAGEIARDLIYSRSRIDLYWPDGRKWQSPLPRAGIALIPFFANTHWSLVCYSADHNAALIYDSLGATSSHAILAYQWLSSLGAQLPETGGRLPTTTAWATRQQRGCECGFYCIIAATYAHRQITSETASMQVDLRVVDVQRRWGLQECIAQDLDQLALFLNGD